MTFYKVLFKSQSCHGGAQKWPLPKGKTPGAWLETAEEPVCCSSGFHLTTEPYLWFKWGCSVYEAEGDGKSHTDGSDKTAFQRARLLRRLPKPMWLQDAEQFIKSIPRVKWFQNGAEPVGVKMSEVRSAARRAAWDAAGDAAWDAAGDAVWNAAWSAARSAARNAAGDAAGNAARNAAGNAAGDAAWDAAWNAAWSAARSAARDAAWNATLLARCLVVSDLIAPEHLAHARDRWAIWEAGYGVFCDVNGELYCYRRP